MDRKPCSQTNVVCLKIISVRGKQRIPAQRHLLYTPTTGRTKGTANRGTCILRGAARLTSHFHLSAGLLGLKHPGNGSDRREESWGFTLFCTNPGRVLPLPTLSHHQLEEPHWICTEFYGLSLPVPQLQWHFLFKGATGFTQGC